MVEPLWAGLLQQLIARRHSLGLSQLDLDAKLGNASGLVSKWECGMRRPTGWNLACWMAALDVKSCFLETPSSPRAPRHSRVDRGEQLWLDLRAAA
jgi:transcriptional regulator with XRE-family HTH domain